LKRVLYVIAAIIIVVVGYIEAFRYVKTGGIKILHDKTGVITKQSDTYLYYKVLNKRLLNDHGIDFRVLVNNDNIKNLDTFMKNELKNMKEHPRKKAKIFVFVLINPKNRYIKISATKEKYKTLFKNKGINNIKKYVINIEDNLLEYELQHTKN